MCLKSSSTPFFYSTNLLNFPLTSCLTFPHITFIYSKIHNSLCTPALVCREPSGNLLKLLLTSTLIYPHHPSSSATSTSLPLSTSDIKPNLPKSYTFRHKPTLTLPKRLLIYLGSLLNHRQPTHKTSSLSVSDFSRNPSDKRAS